MKPYNYEEFKRRIEAINEQKGNLVLSNQYGMLLLLNEQNEILLNMSELVSYRERMENA